VWRVGVNPLDGTPGEPPEEVSALRQIEPFSLSRDGRTAAITPASGGSNLRRLTADEEGIGWALDPAPLTEGTSEKADVAVSPDGQLVAFFDEGFGGDLFILETGGGEPRRLTQQGLLRPRSLSWSPDGTRLAFAAGETSSTLHVIGVEGGDPWMAEPDPVASTNGIVGWCGVSSLVYQTVGVRNMALLPLGSSEGVLILPDNSPGYPFPRGCSPDGSLLAFYWNQPLRGLWVIDTRDGRRVRLSASSQQRPLGWSADGGQIYVFDPGEGVLLAQPVSGGEARVFDLSDLPFDRADLDALSVSADGRTIIMDVSERTTDVWFIENLPFGGQ
jgi:Tol biopolymer transport system component